MTLHVLCVQRTGVMERKMITPLVNIVSTRSCKKCSFSYDENLYDLLV